MFSRILRLFGLKPAKATKPGPRRAVRPRSATAHLFEKRPTQSPQTPAKLKSGPAADNDFNPYNTGKFDRSASWEHISKNQR